MTEANTPTESQGWWGKLKQGLKKSSDRLGQGLKSLIIKKRLDQETIDELEELLIASDLGVEAAAHLTRELAREKLDREVSLEEVKGVLAQSISQILTPYTQELQPNLAHKPHIILVVGVNGSGKTTTIGKLGKFFQDQGRKLHFAAGDTFRAAAVEQLMVWGNRLNIPVTTQPQGSDAASLAFEATQRAQQEGADILLIDTAGRLHNKNQLMDELKKVIRVIQKLDPSAPHTTLLVLDATIGQNAFAQVQTFKEMVGVNGLVVTKLDGTAKGGVVVGLAEKFHLPIYALGVGEQAQDLRSFNAQDFANNLVGLTPIP
jgi:fused signal recognition particle receptor